MNLKNVFLVFSLFIIGASCAAPGLQSPPQAALQNKEEHSTEPLSLTEETSLFRQEGFASWYGPGFYGRKTASGVRFKKEAFTCAHRQLPFGTRLKVTNLSNGKSVDVVVNDRGPYVAPRILDLSYAAAREIGVLKSGVAHVALVEQPKEFSQLEKPSLHK